MAVDEATHEPKEVLFLLQLNQFAGLIEDRFGARYSLRDLH
jgi:hypothetical protein